MSARVHQLLSGAGTYDAITNQALAYRRLLESWGIAGGVFAGALEPGLDGAVQSADRLERELAGDDVLLIHYSAHARALDRAAELDRRKLLVYHNITPAHYLWEYEPHVAALCALGRERLRDLAGRVDGAVAPSEFNASELVEMGFSDVRVEPALYMFDRRRLALREGARSPYDDGRTNVLFVGRLSANKRQDELVKAFALYQRHCDPQARLILPGSPGAGGYRDYLERLAAEVGARDVVLPGAIPQDELNALYAAASVFVCLSEHEGFCIPLLEALHFGLPVIAYRAAAVPEVVGDAAVVIDAKDLAEISELIDVCVRSPGLREELRRRGELRLERYAPARTEAALRSVVEALL